MVKRRRQEVAARDAYNVFDVVVKNPNSSEEVVRIAAEAFWSAAEGLGDPFCNDSTLDLLNKYKPRRIVQKTES